MKLATEIFTAFCCILAVRLVSARNAVKFSKKKVYPNANVKRMGDQSAHPEPLPSFPEKKPGYDVFVTYNNLYQGVRYENDVRVYRQKFDYNATKEGQRVLCQGQFDCLIGHIALESSEAIPVLLRGGVGYRHFMAIVKSKPNRDLKGQVRVYCRHKDGPSRQPRGKAKSKKSKPSPKAPVRRFVFPELERLDLESDVSPTVPKSNATRKCT